MTQADIQRQIEAIRKVSAQIGRSPEASRKFLIDAGIIKEKKKKGIQRKDKKK